MVRMPRLGLSIAAAGLLAGCAAQEVASQENLLAAAGFAVRPANTPQREAQLTRLPANELVMVTRGGHAVWLYADPVNCHCLYIGGPSAYQRYANLKVRRRIAETQLQAAQLDSMNWGWGVWGPWPPYGPFGPPFFY